MYTFPLEGCCGNVQGRVELDVREKEEEKRQDGKEVKRTKANLARVSKVAVQRANDDENRSLFFLFVREELQNLRYED